MNEHRTRGGELPLKRNAQATWRAGVVAGVVAAFLVPMWLIAVDRLVPLHWGLFPAHDYRKLFYIGLFAAAVAPVVALWVAYARQPRGARLCWDAWGITEWDGDGVRVAIPWSEVTVALRSDTGGDVFARMLLERAHLSEFAAGGSVIGLTLRIRGEHGRVIWVTDGVQTPALAGRLTTVDGIGPLLAAIKGAPIVPMGTGHPGENLLALFFLLAIGGYVGAAMGLGVLITEHTVPTYAPHLLGGSAGGLALRALLPFARRLRLGAQARKLRGARRVTLVDNDDTRLIAEDASGARHVIHTGTLAHPDGRLELRRGEAFMVTDRAGAVVAVETVGVREARRTYARALGYEWVLRALLVIPVLAALSLFHARVVAGKPWTVIAGPYDSRDTAGALLDDGARALVATHTSYNHDVALFDLSAEPGVESGSLGLGTSNIVEALALAPGGARAVVARLSDTLVWEVGEREARPRGSLAAARHVRAAAFSPDGGRLLTGGSSGGVDLWETAGFERVHAFTGHTGEVVALAWSDDLALAVSGGADGTARVLDLGSGTERAVLSGHEGPVRAVAFLQATIVTGAADGKVRFFAADGALARTVEAHAGGVTAIARYAGGAFATAGADHRVRVWAPDWRSPGSEDLGCVDLHTDEAVRRAGTITGIAFSSARPDLLALTSHGMLLKIDLTQAYP